MPKLTPETQEARKQQIIDAAIECFARLGYSSASMSDIIKESGLSAGSIYSHFSSKDEILRLAAEQNFEAFEALFNPQNFPTEALISPRSIAQEFANRREIAKKRPLLILQVWADATHNPKTQELVHNNLEIISKRFATVLFPWAEKNAPENIDASLYAARAARTTLTVLQGYLLRSIITPQSASSELLSDLIALLPE